MISQVSPRIALECSLELTSKPMSVTGTRRQTTALLKDVRARNERIEKQQGFGDRSDERQKKKYAAVLDALQTAKGKREMVKGVLRVSSSRALRWGSEF